MTGKYEMKKIRPKDKAIAIIEKDKNSFLVFVIIIYYLFGIQIHMKKHQ
jgi:hypothetical protein